MHVPINDLGRPHEATDEVRRAVMQVVDGGRFLLGPATSAFEGAFARYCGVARCVTVANGTDALELALRALGVGRDDEVVTVGNAGMYTSTACLAIGATPVLVDVDPRTLLMSPASLEAALERATRVRAVVVTHLYGRLADVPALERVVAGRAPLVEDCAQAHGARRDGRRAGSLGALAAFSFYPTKNLGALGDGGAVVTDDPALADRVAQLRQYGWRARYEAELPGRNSRLDELQAAALLAKLPFLDAWNERRRRIARRLRAAARAPFADAGDDDVAHLVVLRAAERERVREALRARGVETAVHYPLPDHRQVALRGRCRTPVPLDATEAAAGEIFTVPCFPTMTDAELDHVAAALAEVLA